ncbi:unnamed protein product [Adineta steineri]|uniref:Uncharacterized protein n=1 Tax=Adineta steineri TaxID=433720 RepID=A0A813MQN6_9BILA|nr:unnamed protein product [Adineta steineri]CAF3712536.1 unnamed protein product [Adineta steineri]
MTDNKPVHIMHMIEDPNSSSRHVKINRTRKILLVLLSILFAFNLLYLIFIVHAYIDNSWFSHYFKNNYELLWTLACIVYNAFGLLTTYQYFRKGLRVFAWIGTISLISSVMMIGIICIIAFYTKEQVKTHDDNYDIIGPLIFILIFILTSIMLLIIVLLSFKLSNLLYKNRNTMIRTL